MFSASRMISAPVKRVLQQQRAHASTSSKPPPSDFRAILQQFGLLARFGAAAYFVQVYVASTTMSVGPSMQPTFNTVGDLLFTEYITPRLKKLSAGDVVVAVKPTEPRMAILKRIRGMPGERICVQTGRGREPRWIVVPDHHVWLEGDNPIQSSDSRDYGPVPMILIRGKVWFRFWPLSQAGWVKSRVIDHSSKGMSRGYIGTPAARTGLRALLDEDADKSKASAEAQSELGATEDEQKMPGPAVDS